MCVKGEVVSLNLSTWYKLYTSRAPHTLSSLFLTSSSIFNPDEDSAAPNCTCPIGGDRQRQKNEGKK